ncbi:MAG TPA: MarR family winged helix-turn-helix transcriptional regulator [Steroidobacteraceae bacterium]|nr:MarR family winged helix-turn-helix transcriptional regulator [Steroidobacteraceae bacterium]
MQHYRAESYKARSSVGYLIKRAHSLLIDQLEAAVAGSDITATQWVVLMHLRDGLAINASDLCAQLRHDSGALTRVIDQLEARGLVQRERSREDRREVQLRLTDAGIETVASLVPTVVDKFNFALRDFSRAEASELNRLLIKLITSLDSASVEPGEAA